MRLPPDTFRYQIAEAKKRLAKLMREQQEINQETTDLRELIRASANFLPEDEREAELIFLEFFKSPGSITEAVRLAIFVSSAVKKRITPPEIKSLAESLGFDFSEYSNPMASVHTILKRMKEMTPPSVDYDEATDVYWYGESAFASSVDEVVSPQMFSDIYKDVIAALITGMEADKGSILSSIQEATKVSIRRKVEAVAKGRQKD